MDNEIVEVKDNTADVSSAVAIGVGATGAVLGVAAVALGVVSLVKVKKSESAIAQFGRITAENQQMLIKLVKAVDPNGTAGIIPEQNPNTSEKK